MALLSFGIFSSSSCSFSVLPPQETLTFMRPSPSPSGLRMLRTITSCTVSRSDPGTGTGTGTRKIRGIMKPRKVSPEMEDLVGAPEISRTQVLKRIWAYIKDKNLQDPTDKRTINCDEKLKKVFAGKDQVEMLEIARLISPHFL